MTMLEEAMLALTSAGKALSTDEIVRRIVAQKWCATSEQETHKKVSDLLQFDADHYGKHSLFVEAKPGVFGLRSWEMD